MRTTCDANQCSPPQEFLNWGQTDAHWENRAFVVVVGGSGCSRMQQRRINKRYSHECLDSARRNLLRRQPRDLRARSSRDCRRWDCARWISSSRCANRCSSERNELGKRGRPNQRVLAPNIMQANFQHSAPRNDGVNRERGEQDGDGHNPTFANACPCAAIFA